MLQCYVEGRNFINGIEKRYSIAEGAVFIDNYNETLDSASIKLMQLPSEIEIEPYDIVVIIGAGATRRYCVDSYTCTQTSLIPEIFQYDISLFSETKLLEGVLCPNLAITKIVDQPSRSVAYYLIQYLNLYSPKTNSSEISGAFGNKFAISVATSQKFASVDCPEMQWNQPTLREVFNDLMMVADCIPVLRNNVLGYIDLSAIGNEITADQKKCINYIQKSQSSADYVSEIKMNVVNAANNTDLDEGNPPDDSTHIIEEIGFRNDQSYFVDTDNMLLQTSFPIWKLYSATIKLSANYTAKFANIVPGGPMYELTATASIEIPLQDFILEYGEWITKEVYYSSFGTSQPLSTDYQNTCLYYVRGSKDIRNFNGKQNVPFLFIPNQVSVFELIVNSQAVYDAAYQDAINKGPGGSYESEPLTFQINSRSDYREVTFKVSYDALSECLFQASKSPFPRHKRIIMDNQSNSYVDLNRMGLFEYMKAKRLGNKMSLVNGRFPVSGINIPELSEKINDKIIFRRELAYYKQHIDANFTATENYVLKDYFTGVKSKLRSWRLIDGNEALLRNELIKFYINDNISSVQNTTRVIPVYDNLDTYLEYFNYCVVQFSAAGNLKLPENGVYRETSYSTPGLAVEFTKHKIGNSVIFTFTMPDNIFAGRYINDYRGGPTNQYVQQTPIRYADNNGEFIRGVACFYKEFNPNIWFEVETNRALKPLSPIYKYGESGSQNLVAQIPFIVYKDNKEIFALSIQFEINPDANDIFLGKK